MDGAESLSHLPSEKPFTPAGCEGQAWGQKMCTLGWGLLLTHAVARKSNAWCREEEALGDLNPGLLPGTAGPEEQVLDRER